MKRQRWKKKRIKSTVDRWKKRLRLQDWKVYTQYKRRRDMDGVKRAGEIEFNMNHKSAIMTISDPVDIPREYDYDPERTIVHELLHLHMVTFFDHDAEQNPEKKIAWEQVISILSDSLVSAYRKR